MEEKYSIEIGGIIKPQKIEENIKKVFEKKKKEDIFKDDLSNFLIQSIDKISRYFKNADIVEEEVKKDYNIFKEKLLYDLGKNDYSDNFKKLDDGVFRDIYREFKYQVYSDQKCFQIISLSSHEIVVQQIRGFISQYKSEWDNKLYPIEPIDNFLQKYKSHINSAFIGENDKISTVIKELREGDQTNIFIRAISGMGKTRWIWEAFNEKQDKKNIYYCDFRGPNIKKGLSVFLLMHCDEDCLLILDDCLLSEFKKIKETIGSKSKIRIIGFCNDLSEFKGYNTELKFIDFDVNELEEVTATIINQKLISKIPDEQQRQQLIERAGGIPYMAILIVNVIQENSHLDIDALFNDNNLYDKILDPKSDLTDDQKKILKTLSLFDKIGKSKSDTKFYDYVIKSEAFTKFTTQVVRKNIFEEVIRKFKQRQLIEEKYDGITIRPLILAISLVGEWFYDCDEERLLEINSEINEIKKEDRVLALNIIKSLEKRFESFKGNPMAEELIGMLMGEEGLFSSEKVVCSDLGSRLFLVMTTVNPVAVSDCLYRILYNKDVDWIEQNIVEDVRRNIVWSLSKTCALEDSFEKSVLLLGKLALAENENWSNNATGVFRQLFHIRLSGTEVDLIERFNIIDKLYHEGPVNNKLVLIALNSAFSYKGVVRFGEFENFGDEKHKEYIPKNHKEIETYWNDCENLIIDWINRDDEIVNQISEIIEHHIVDICSIGNICNFEDVIQLIIEKRGGEWRGLLDNLKFAQNNQNIKISEDCNAFINSLIQQLSQNDFVSDLVNAQNEYKYKTKNLSFQEKRGEVEVEYYKTYAEKFINNKIYQNKSEIKTLLDLDYNISVAFIKAIAREMGEDVVNATLHVGLVWIKEKNKNYVSFFLLYFCGNISRDYNIEWFYDELRDNGYFPLYIRMKLSWEGDDLSLLRELISIFKGKDVQYIQYYLDSKYCKSSNDVYTICDLVSKEIPNEYHQILIPLLSHTQYDKIWNDEKTLQIVQDVLLQCLWKNDDYSYDVINLVEYMLSDYEVKHFAVEVNKIIIERTNLSNLPYNADYKSLYHKLLPKYKDVIWVDLSKIFINKDNKCWINLYNYIGAMDEDESALFINNEDSIKELCMKYSKTDTPVRIAHMVPKYHKDENGNIDRFSDFILWMLDNIKEFKNPQDILLAIDCRISSYSCIGSVIPLYEDMINCYEKVINANKYEQIVVDWACKMIDNVKKNIEMEHRREDYMGLSYN